ncbi:hypothetical protein B7P43_G05144 [Cryptotermes secundus]|uniref:Uncharacterized protein n=1 Tax=Cryptotermes secundus TaxID=105785 RepID=A0A2J7PEY4_9NEOP|nr:hypothetical protein B7P43_G05144 [Cryptotermes secundus]
MPDPHERDRKMWALLLSILKNSCLRRVQESLVTSSTQKSEVTTLPLCPYSVVCQIF